MIKVDGYFKKMLIYSNNQSININLIKISKFWFEKTLFKKDNNSYYEKLNFEV